MSYAFTARGADRVAALKAVETSMAEVVAGQPIHERDRIIVISNAASTAALLQEDVTKDVCISVNGSLSWGATDPAKNPPITSASINVGAYLDTRPEGK